ncbi:MAG: sulfatase-like hydrolase/transferase [Kiritimatiellales bacterium]|nr:sulfatase-like hydrolase/transferase [Kiritimatiellales bacterium]
MKSEPRASGEIPFNENTARAIKNLRLPRRRFIQGGAIGIASSLSRHISAAETHGSTKERRPNFLFISVDQLSFHATPLGGCTYARTPNIDRIMKRGTSFDLSYSANPVCSPARASWFTGRACAEHGVFGNGKKMQPQIPDLGQWLQQAGYDPYYVGKWHIPGRDVTKSFNWLHNMSQMGELGDPYIARTCQAFLHSRKNDEKPFFLAAGLVNPHDIPYWIRNFRNYTGDLRYPEIAGELPPLPPAFNFDSRDEPERLQEFRKLMDSKNTHSWSETMWRFCGWAYFRYVEMVDASVGRILDGLEFSGHADNTVVVFTSDHGEGRGCHKLTEKGFFYDEAARVPFAISWPGRIPSNTVDTQHLVSGRDFTPTICDYAGIAPPPDMCGRSLKPLLEGCDTTWRDYVISETYNAHGHMVRTKDFKFITYEGCPTEQLFDMKNDPMETRSLIREGKYAGVVEQHRAMLKEWTGTLKPAPGFYAHDSMPDQNSA